ncbi:type II toxin-antitoxin system ParD family antitoxin [Tardiphaga alba]|uniref:Type II toxin-antitoxin system ParD family antitoxin n=1 Tax=Tardiphaga alba TaxID=340268 RepID=A0ABX8AAG2_9BRAD|nr:type II toxin-antitoxin system ParD family antitoxin [Tardiphaga alba]QUS40457.1 type II toxin-antitoxin system ParD family antitoxin [Tardiphaga alba]
MVAKALQVELTLEQQELLQRHLDNGEYESPSDVIGDALHALDERNKAFDHFLRREVEAAFASKAPSVPIDEAFRRARAAIASQAKAAKRDT